MPLGRRLLIYSIVAAIIAISWKIYNNFHQFNCVKTKEIIWFARQIDSNNYSENNEKWNKTDFEKIENEWKDRAALMKRNLNTKSWIPLNVHDSRKLETIWNLMENHFKHCPLHDTANEECKAAEESLKQAEVFVMNNVYKVSIYFGKKYWKLFPVYWKKETKTWAITRGEILYEVPQPPHMSYFQEISPNLEMQTFYLPALDSRHCNSKNTLAENENFNSDKAHKIYSHLIMVVHGIGHHEGEESIVQNAYENKFQIENLFFIGSPLSRFIASDAVCKKVSNETIDENVAQEDFIEIMQKTQHEFYEAITSGEVPKDNYLVDNLIIFLTKSINEYRTFSSYSLNCSKVDPNKLRKNKWIKNGRLFNILHSDDPVAQRLEILFHNDYKFVDPFTLNLHKSFHKSFWNVATVSEEEETELAKFHHRFNSDRKNASSHIGFLKYEYQKHKFSFEAFTKNYTLYVKDGEEKPWSIFFRIVADFFTTLFNDFGRLLERIEIETIVEGSEKFISFTNNERQLLHRIDYDLKELFQNSKNPKFKGFDKLLATEKQFVNWATEVLYTHMSYWKRPEVTFLMANIIYGYDSTTFKELTPASSNFNADESSIILKACKICALLFWIYVSIYLIIWLLPIHTPLINCNAKLTLYEYDTWKNDLKYIKYYGIKSLLLFAALIRILVKFLMSIIFWAVLFCSFLIPAILNIVFDAFKMTSNYKYLVYSIFFLPAFLNLMFWEHHDLRKEDDDQKSPKKFSESPWYQTGRRFIKNVLFTTTFIIFLVGVLFYVTELYREYETKCKNLAENGNCLKYEMVNINPLKLLPKSFNIYEWLISLPENFNFKIFKF
uniref:DDHD domain-containing protein n=1 Tax=Panagrolaimus davidi TaxID=227884 RepID=A0A914Q9N6_9BILA